MYRWSHLIPQASHQVATVTQMSTHAHTQWNSRGQWVQVRVQSSGDAVPSVSSKYLCMLACVTIKTKSQIQHRSLYNYLDRDSTQAYVYMYMYMYITRATIYKDNSCPGAHIVF